MPTEINVLAALKVLYANGLIDMNELKNSAFLTTEGYDAVERLKGLGVQPGGYLTI